MYFSQLYSPGKSSKIGWWRGNCKDPPPPLQMSGSDVNDAAYPPFRNQTPSSYKDTAGRGGDTHRNTHLI